MLPYCIKRYILNKNALSQSLLELESFERLKSSFLAVSPKTALCTGVIDTQKAQLVHALSANLNRPVLYVTHSELKAKEAYDDLCYFFDGNVFLYPSKDPVFYSADVRSSDITQNRFHAVDSLVKNEKKVVVLSVEALFDRLVKKEIFTGFIMELSVGQTVSVDEFARRLVLMGYERSDRVYSCGQFSIRGGIIDLFTTAHETAVRIELWGDEIDSIRLLDTDSQRSVEKIDFVRVFPMRELLYEPHMLPDALSEIATEYNKTYSDYVKKGLTEEAAALKDTIASVIEKFQTRFNFSGAEGYAKYFYPEKTSLLDYLTDDYIIVADEPQRIEERAENVKAEFHESLKNRIQKGYLLPSQLETELEYVDVLSGMKKYAVVLLSTFTTAVKGFSIGGIYDFTVKSSAIAGLRFDIFADDLKYYIEKKYRVVIFAGAKTRAEKLLSELRESGFTSEYSENLPEGCLEYGKITVTKGSLKRGFEYPSIKLVVISDKEVFGEEKIKRAKKKKKGARIDSFLDLKVGDYVVHDNHGVGIYKGIEKIITDDISRDYMKIAYADGGALFVHTSQMDMIQKYIGGEDAKPKVNKLGGTDWSKAKAKVKSAVKQLAVDLVKLYAKRRTTRGHMYPGDTVWQSEFESLFPFDETDDQLNAIADVKHDMESPTVMDRLICGDVGYGKTEVAIRAAFKAVNDNKQVAVLVPTTILAQQHYNTFTQRMKDYPVKIDLMSRFRTAKQQKETATAVKKGHVDIVIGTHRLLSKDIGFNNLGLIVVDEEQRFGVNHKEKLKEMKENVDVLTLTATPIPRTLHMSLSGIRDMSVLEEPPNERQPIQTYVMEYNPELIRDAVHRELARNGQVYFLHNRVRNIEDTAFRLQQLIPEANIAYAHGQMKEHELENVMMDFIDGQIDVLVCTTIIETGLDIPNVNTIIVADADHMGLSQLYQLRGRVGRSTRLAYAYLMYRKDKVLTEVSEKRLQTIKEFTEFGSGFKIAMRDLEIRGSGNLLGAEQSGHMAAVGYDTYCKLLAEAVAEETGKVPETAFETTIDVNIDAYIPGDYIEDEMQKLEIYKKISLITEKADYYDIQEEIEDRYGTLPKWVQNLLDVAYLKAVAHTKHIISVTQKGNRLVMLFKPDAEIDPLDIEKLVNANSAKLSFTVALNPYMTYKIGENEKFLGAVTELLSRL